MGRTSRVLALLCVFLGSAATPVAAYPDRPVKMIVPYPAGGTTDILARIIAARLEARLGKPFIVENRAGASGMIGTAAVAQSPPDGYTLVVGTISTHGINASVFKTMTYDSVRDFAPITIIADTPNVLMTHPSLPVKNVGELIAYAGQNPGILNFGSTSTAGSPHMSGELLKSLTKINIQHVPYRGAAPMLNDLLGGHVKIAFDNLPSSMEHIRAGSVRALAVTTAKRFPGAPEIPTMAESVPGYEVAAWFGVLAPAKTPQPIVDLLYRNISETLKEEPIRQRLDALGAVPTGNPPDDFARRIEEEVRKWKDVVAATGVKVE